MCTILLPKVILFQRTSSSAPRARSTNGQAGLAWAFNTALTELSTLH
ncbi:MAG: hypothetical protein LBK65_06575 [Tannerellaceae bacterium]|nr:hypothetical protein [Tannerellaceae bacterium]